MCSNESIDMIFEKKKEKDRKYEIYLDYIPFLKESREIYKRNFEISISV